MNETFKIKPGCLYIRQWFAGYELRLYLGSEIDKFGILTYTYISMSCSQHYFRDFELFETYVSPTSFSCGEWMLLSGESIFV